MQRELCIKLLNLLKRYGIELRKGSISSKTLLNLPDKVVEKILDTSNKFQLLNVLAYLEHCYSRGVKNDEFLLPAIDIIASCNREFQIEYAIKVLHNENAQNANINFEGAKIITECDEEFQAKYCMKVLCDVDSINTGVVLDGAKIIASCKKEFQAEYCAHILRSGKINKNNKSFALKFMSTIATCEVKKQVCDCYAKFLNTFHIFNQIYFDEGEYESGVKSAEAIAADYELYMIEEPLDIKKLTVNGILSLMEKEPFEETKEITEETVSQYIKKNTTEIKIHSSKLIKTYCIED